jgi:hypothetical protein
MLLVFSDLVENCVEHLHRANSVFAMMAYHALPEAGPP